MDCIPKSHVLHGFQPDNVLHVSWPMHCMDHGKCTWGDGETGMYYMYLVNTLTHVVHESNPRSA